MCSLTVMAPKMVGTWCLSELRPIAGLCAMRKVLGYARPKSFPPLRYESLQTALLKTAELSLEWQKEIVVVQLDVKKAFDHVNLVSPLPVHLKVRGPGHVSEFFRKHEANECRTLRDGSNVFFWQQG